MLQLNYGYPHISYFTEQSLSRFLEHHGFSVVAAFHDSEITLRTIWNRVGYENPPSLLLHAAYSVALALLWVLAGVTGKQDALILFARPRSHAAAR